MFYLGLMMIIVMAPSLLQLRASSQDLISILLHVYGQWCQKKHVDKFKDLNPCVEGLYEDHMEVLESNHLEEILGDLSLGEPLEETIGDPYTEGEVWEALREQEEGDFVYDNFELEFERNFRKLMPYFHAEDPAAHQGQPPGARHNE